MRIKKHKLKIDEIKNIKKCRNLTYKTIASEIGICAGSLYTFVSRECVANLEDCNKIDMWILENRLALYTENKVSFYG